MNSPSIFSWIKSEESRFETDEISVGQNWNWNFRNHVQMIFHLKNGVFFTGENDWLRAFKNIMEPVLNLSYWMEDIELKDVVFYIESAKCRALSFLIKKYHDEVYVKENDLDMMFDEITESDIDYGGALVQKTNKSKPEVFDLNTIAFCDQTDMLGGPIAFKHYFSPDKLREMSKFGWGEESNGATISLDELATLANFEKDPVGMTDAKKNKTPGKVVEVYIVRGSLPEHYLKDNDDMECHCNQVQIVAFYNTKDKKQEGVVLYRKKEEEGNLKFHTSKKVTRRALGRGVGEGLLHPQIWSNFLTIHKMNMLESASKVLPWTDDPAFGNRSKIQDMDNLEISTLEEGRKIGLIPTSQPSSVQLFEQSINDWYEQAQLTGSAFDPVLGKEAASGTTFRGQERVVSQGRGLHERRRGQRAKFIEEIYRDWIIPDMVKGILNGKEFLATLTSEELRWVSEQLAENYASDQQFEAVVNGEIPQDREELKLEYLKDFSKKGNKHMLKILKDEFKDIEVKMGISVSGKQKDLAALSDKILSIVQFAVGNPQGWQMAKQDPSISRALNDLLEFSGLSEANFADFSQAQMQMPMQQGGGQQLTMQPAVQA